MPMVISSGTGRCRPACECDRLPPHRRKDVIPGPLLPSKNGSVESRNLQAVHDWRHAAELMIVGWICGLGSADGRSDHHGRRWRRPNGQQCCRPLPPPPALRAGSSRLPYLALPQRPLRPSRVSPPRRSTQKMFRTAEALRRPGQLAASASGTMGNVLEPSGSALTRQTRKEGLQRSQPKKP
jgi:hypothetical protein